MRPTRPQSLKALTWALIPLLMVGSLPRVSCLCADGEHKLLCERALFSVGQSAMDPTQKASRHPCCRAAGAPRIAIASQKSCCQRQTSAATCDEIGQSCRPLFDVPAFVATATNVLSDHLADIAGPIAEKITPAVRLAADACRQERWHITPAPDLVIAHQSLVI